MLRTPHIVALLVPLLVPTDAALAQTAENPVTDLAAPIQAAIDAGDLDALEAALEPIPVRLIEEPESATLQEADAAAAARALFGLPSDAAAEDLPDAHRVAESVALCESLPDGDGGAVGRVLRGVSRLEVTVGPQTVVRAWVAAAVARGKWRVRALVVFAANDMEAATTGCRVWSSADGRALDGSLSYFSETEGLWTPAARATAFLTATGDFGGTAMDTSIWNALIACQAKREPAQFAMFGDTLVLRQKRTATIDAGPAVAYHIAVLFRDGADWTGPITFCGMRMLEAE